MHTYTIMTHTCGISTSADGTHTMRHAVSGSVAYDTKVGRASSFQEQRNGVDTGEEGATRERKEPAHVMERRT